MRVLFICTGNTCSSPIAEALFRQKGVELDEIEVRSAGILKFKRMSTFSNASSVDRSH